MKPLFAIRILGATAVSAIAAWFVKAYTRTSNLRFVVDHEVEPGMNGAQLLLRYSWVGYAIPLLALASGIAVYVLMPKRRELGAEAVAWITAILAFAWVLFCLLIWQMANVPWWSGTGVHY